MKQRSYFEYILNPLELLRTKKVLHVNPTIPVERNKDIKSNITVYEYNKDSYEYYRYDNVEQTFPFLFSKSITWVNFDGLKKEDVDKIGDHYHIHPLIIEDILSVGQRPKTDEFDGFLFSLLNILYFNDTTQSVETEQVSLVLGQNFVITFQEDATRDVFQPLREKLKTANSKLRQNGSDFLFYSLLDLIVDNYFIVMDKLGDKIEDLEESIIRNSNTKSIAHINALRKEMILLKRNVAPVREMVSGILRSDSELIEERTEKYFKDVYDHIVQATDLAENYRDMMMNLHDLYLNNINLKMNEVMKVMAVVTCLMAPATVIGGMFGMNFEKIPLLHNQWGFFISVGLMILIPLIMVYIFRRRGWF